jgi:hypothetical protein
MKGADIKTKKLNGGSIHITSCVWNLHCSLIILMYFYIYKQLIINNVSLSNTFFLFFVANPEKKLLAIVLIPPFPTLKMLLSFVQKFQSLSVSPA